MIEPTEEDIGRKVIYKKDWMTPVNYEYGVITSFNYIYVHVRYGNDTGSKATLRNDLEWDFDNGKGWKTQIKESAIKCVGCGSKHFEITSNNSMFDLYKCLRCEHEHYVRAFKPCFYCGQKVIECKCVICGKTQQ